MTTPVLPVPELEPTVQRLLSAIRPLQDDAEAELQVHGGRAVDKPGCAATCARASPCR